ncbi:MAG: hypothetical protein A2Z88_02780 [Omnitrophica WOR_2 bacterium GWA2_47_8]|nr:MAG: hypothetical protein A2Z88_02780 [Omnitrophica WOR_2 bacterium GWA2_47_8]
MDILFICLIAFAASLLTLYSGFGLGTILMPVMAIFFPLDIAIALTAAVHFLNNLFKLALLGKKAHWDIVLKFGLPAFVSAFLGAKALFWFETIPLLFAYQLGNRVFEVTVLKLSIAILIIIFVILELIPKFQKLSFSPRFVSLGGLVTGFLGGLSGHQGALRSAFLIKANLTKESFIATGVVIACLVDLSRLFVYSQNVFAQIADHKLLVLSAAVSAFAGVFLGARLLHKITMAAVQRIVTALLLTIAILLAAGMV